MFATGSAYNGASTTVYTNPTGANSPVLNVSTGVLIPVACDVSFRVFSETAPLITETFTLRAAPATSPFAYHDISVTSATSCTLSGAQQFCQSSTSYAAAANTIVTIQMTPSGTTPNPQRFALTVVCD